MNINEIIANVEKLFEKGPSLPTEPTLDTIEGLVREAYLWGFIPKNLKNAILSGPEHVNCGAVLLFVDRSQCVTVNKAKYRCLKCGKEWGLRVRYSTIIGAEGVYVSDEESWILEQTTDELVRSNPERKLSLHGFSADSLRQEIRTQYESQVRECIKRHKEAQRLDREAWERIKSDDSLFNLFLACCDSGIARELGLREQAYKILFSIDPYEACFGSILKLGVGALYLFLQHVLPKKKEGKNEND